jgi:sulfite reductase (NADPH) hemoprotein beta-component
VHEIVRADAEADPLYDRWLQRNVLPHRNPQLRAVTLSFKRLGQAPGDADGDQLDAAPTWPTASPPAKPA